MAADPADTGTATDAAGSDADAGAAAGRDAEPPGLRRARRAATLLDAAVRVPGTSIRVGLDPILSVLPVAGDAVGVLCSLYVVAEAARAGVRPRTLAAMLGLIAVDAAVGSLPLVGPVADAVLRVNERNVALFERAVSRRGASRSRP